MKVLNDIRAFLRTETARFDTEMRSSLSSDSLLLQQSVEHFLAKDGKRIRPLLVMLAARTVADDIAQSTIHAAVSLELLHSASLIHDDVIDDTFERRGRPSMNAMFNNKVSVLVGDFFLAASLRQAVETYHFPILTAISNLSRLLTVGEIKQLSFARGELLSELDYYEVIDKKTASLFMTCLKVGALSVDAPALMVDALAEFGSLMGRCFQIRDDIFDYYEDPQIGKPTGNDIREGKITLPLLHAISAAHSDADNREQALTILKSKDYTTENIHFLIDFAKRNGGIEYAESQMHLFVHEAIELLHVLPSSDAKRLLIDCLKFIVKRDY